MVSFGKQASFKLIVWDHKLSFLRELSGCNRQDKQIVGFGNEVECNHV